MNRNMTARGLLLGSVIAAALLVASAAFAQPYRRLGDPAYRELRRLAQQLDARAQHAANRADHGPYRLYRRDSTFFRDVTDFARRTRRLDARLARYRAEPWAVREDVRDLRRSAREIRQRVRQSRWTDEHTLGDWSEMVEILNRMERVSDGRIDFDGIPGPGDGAPPPRVYERDPNARPPEPDPRPYERDPRGNPPPAQGRDEYGTRNPSESRDPRFDQIASLGRELEERAARALDTAERVAADRGPYKREFMVSIRDFSDQAGAFRESIGAGTHNPGQLRAEASRLLQAARENDQRMRQENAFREVWPDWQGAMQTLQRIIDLLR